MRRLTLIGLAAAMLAACTTPTIYAPAASPTAVGFHEQQIEQNRFQVSFHGGTDADPRRIYDLALRRAAELTVQQQQEWFQVVDRRTDVAPGNGPTFSLGIGGASFGRHSGVGGGVGTDFGGPGAQATVTLEVLMGRGPRPSPQAYDARQLLSSMVGAPA